MGFMLQGAFPRQGTLPQLSARQGSPGSRPPSATGAAALPPHPSLPLSSLQDSGWLFPHR